MGEGEQSNSSMALEAVVFQQEIMNNKDICTMGELAWVANCPSLMQCNFEEWGVNSSPSPDNDGGSTTARRKRRRAKVVKNKEEVESQRMNHIAIERNRRKLMNEYLAVLRSLMPSSYVQRGDQASIVGGAINFVKELEQLLQSLEAKKRTQAQSKTPPPFADFFTFPQYTCTLTPRSSLSANPNIEENEGAKRPKKKKAMADIEVTMVESHANLKILVKRKPKQLLRMVHGLQNLKIVILHLNASTIDHLVLYSFSLKVEDNSELSSVDDIANASHEIIRCMEEEQASSS